MIIIKVFCFADDNEISASGENTKAPIGMGVLYGAFQKAGYQTLFQEDLCWYDIWGSLLTNNQKRAVPSGDAEFKSRLVYLTCLNLKSVVENEYMYLVLIQGVQCKEDEVKNSTLKNDMFVGVGEMLKRAPLRVYFSLLK